MERPRVDSILDVKGFNRTLMIMGIGGRDKSEICLNFAQDHRDDSAYFRLFSFTDKPNTRVFYSWSDGKSFAIAEYYQ